MSQLFDDAVPDWFELGKAPVNTPPFSFSCWFKTNDVSIGQTLIAISDKTSTADYHRLHIAGAAAGDPLVASSFDIGGARGSASSSNSVLVNTWHHGVGVWRFSTDREVYLDNVMVNNNTAVSPSTMDELGYGRLLDSTPSEALSGNMAYAAIWDVDLTAIDVGILFDGISPMCVRPGNLVRFDDLTEPPTQPEKGTQKPKKHLIVRGTPTSVADQPPKGNHIPELPFLIPKFKGKSGFKGKQMIV